MSNNSALNKIAIIGGGPAALFLLKALTQAGNSLLHITIFEQYSRLGMGMPYSPAGSNAEHITNVSANEIPDIITSFGEWISKIPSKELEQYGLPKKDFHEYKVLPRLLFGEYLSAQFDMVLEDAKKQGISVEVLLNTCVKDINDDVKDQQVMVLLENGSSHPFNNVVICTGHRWLKLNEGKVPGWLDSPYPPQKLASFRNVPIAVKGASLTAIDAVRTLSRANGIFVNEREEMTYRLSDDCKNFRLVLHSLHGLLPAVRFHLQDSHLSQGYSFTEEEIFSIKEKNDGFVPLDLVYQKCFKEPLKKLHSELYEAIQHMTMEQFVDHMMALREKPDGFTLLKAEYKEAERSIERRQSVLWKEMLAVLSYELNYPAKHFCAEDMLRLKKTLMPLISIIIAFVPQSSCDELIALHDAGVLALQPVDEDSDVTPGAEGGCIYRYKDESGQPVEKGFPVFINAVGQPAFMLRDFVFPTPVQDRTVTEAHVKFLDVSAAEKQIARGNEDIVQTGPADYWLKLPGIQINDHYQVLDKYGTYNPRIQLMAVPYIAGLNPDYSGLDFCERAGGLVAEKILEQYKLKEAG